MHGVILAQTVLSVLLVIVCGMSRLTEEDLRHSTLHRQFPDAAGTDAAAVLQLFAQLGPVQSQVARSPFLHVAARAPGTTYSTICELFESHHLLKASNLRGTVHTSGRESFSRLDAVAAGSRAGPIRTTLGLSVLAPGDVTREVERFCAERWRSRDEIVDHLRSWLAEHESPDSVARLAGTFAESMVWGHSGLARRPRDQCWEKRTDIFRRTARNLAPNLDIVTPAQALIELIRTHLGAYGPVTRNDLAFFFGVGLGQVDAALSTLGDAVVRLVGPDAVNYLDLAEPPLGGSEDPGLKLLGEFDGLLLGFCGRNRTRFVDHEGLSKIWAKTNGMFSPFVLQEGRVVATWRTRTLGSRTDVEISMLGQVRLVEDLLATPVADVEAALGLRVTDVHIS